MTWFRTDDSFSDHPKVHKLQDESKHWKGALSLWLMAGSWCSKNETDGALTMATVKRLGGTAIEAQALVDCRLWEVSETGFQFHDWAVYNPLREKLEVKREEGRQRVAKSREKNPRGNAVTKHNGNAVTDSERTRVVRSTPIPIPIPIPETRESASARDPVGSPAESGAKESDPPGGGELTETTATRPAIRPPIRVHSGDQGYSGSSSVFATDLRTAIAAEAMALNISPTPRAHPADEAVGVERAREDAKSRGIPYRQACAELARAALIAHRGSKKNFGTCLREASVTAPLQRVANDNFRPSGRAFDTPEDV